MCVLCPGAKVKKGNVVLLVLKYVAIRVFVVMMCDMCTDICYRYLDMHGNSDNNK